jgi:hypothetical protein
VYSGTSRIRTPRNEDILINRIYFAVPNTMFVYMTTPKSGQLTNKDTFFRFTVSRLERFPFLQGSAECSRSMMTSLKGNIQMTESGHNSQPLASPLRMPLHVSRVHRVYCSVYTSGASLVRRAHMMASLTETPK